MLSFGFEGGEYVTVSVEARKETHESYSWFQGAFKKYELIYVIGDERDLVLTRAAHRADDVYLFPIKTTKESTRALFLDMVSAADRLRDHPEHYNTFINNCTSRLRDHVNRVTPGRIPPTWRTILPGYSDELILSLGLVDSDLDIDGARERHWVNDRAKRYADSEDFSTLIRRVPD